MKTSDIRKSFLDYFKKQNHTIIPSSPLVPNDPSVLFTIAGMIQFKDVFLGNEKRDYTRAASCQKCVRAGGKQNDLDNVGFTTRHNTFFEMLGNFSFGDYFKEKAIKFAWELMSKEWGLNKERLYVTIYHTDQEAEKLWKDIAGIKSDHLIKIATKDNYWEMGDVGPCGPSSEIFYDLGKDVQGGLPGTPEEDGDRFLEIWNLVFMTFEKLVNGETKELPSKNIDTGASLERMAMVLQNVTSVFDIDYFKNIIKATEDEISTKVTSKNRASFNVIADHLRTAMFLIGDGIMPENIGRGYVLRRIIRRAVRHYNLLGCKEPLLNKLIHVVENDMSGTYPEIKQASKTIQSVIKNEEEKFLETLDTGLEILKTEVEKLKPGAILPGDVAFKLYDTYGFPLDITEIIMGEKGYKVDTAGFEKEMEKQKERSKQNWKGSGNTGTEKIWFDLKQKFAATKFLGYNDLKTSANINAIVKDGQELNEISANDEAIILADQTTFYGEKGGQVGDQGLIKNEAGEVIAKVIDTQIMAENLIAHIIKSESKIKKDDRITLLVDYPFRKSVMRNHSSAHLLQAALKKVLGDHVAQKGSWVGYDRMRFDFSHNQALTAEEISKIESMVNSWIHLALDVSCREMAIDEARKTGATAMFGEKYGDIVRIVKMSDAINLKDISIEFCGGTHVKNTEDIGAFKIINEGSIAAGIRRIEALCSTHVADYAIKNDTLLSEIIGKFKSSKQDITQTIQRTIDDNKSMAKEVADLKKKLALSKTESEKIKIEGQEIKIIFKTLEGIEAKELKTIAYEFLNNTGAEIIFLQTEAEKKSSAVLAVADTLTDKFNASNLIKKASEVMGGKGGGGQPTIAQCGGQSLLKKEEFIKLLK
jgi:alanyl-tRNA synthetase